MSNNKLKVFTLGLLTIALSGCEAGAGGGGSIELPPSFTAPSPTPTPTPSPSASVSAIDFCVDHELRDVFSDPVPVGRALWTALYHDAGSASHLADPMCLLSEAVTTGGVTYIPCAVSIPSGLLYSRTWQPEDRDWIKDAIDRERSLQSVQSLVAVSSTTITPGSPLYVNSNLQGLDAVVITVSAGANWTGYCQ